MGDERVEIVLDEQYDKSFKHFMYNVSEDFLEKKNEILRQNKNLNEKYLFLQDFIWRTKGLYSNSKLKWTSISCLSYFNCQN